MAVPGGAAPRRRSGCSPFSSSVLWCLSGAAMAVAFLGTMMAVTAVSRPTTPVLEPPPSPVVKSQELPAVETQDASVMAELRREISELRRRVQDATFLMQSPYPTTTPDPGNVASPTEQPQDPYACSLERLQKQLDELGNGMDRPHIEPGVIQEHLAAIEAGKPCPPLNPRERASASYPWIVIGIPSVSRKDGLDYLNPALDYIAEQLPDPYKRPGELFVDRVKILVLSNSRESAHPAFEKAQKRFNPKVNPIGRYFVFVKNQSPVTEGLKRDNGSPNVPGARVRQQTLDMASVYEEAAKLKPWLFFLMEDDFRLCPHFFQVLHYALFKVNLVDPNWLMLRISYGLAGGVMHGSDTRAFAKYLRDNVMRRPPDHLLVEWFAGEKPASAAYKGTRKHFAFRYNLLQHFGTVSSLRASKQGRYAGCFEALDSGSLFEVEVFKAKECPNEDVWPCPPGQWTEAHPALDLGGLQGKVYRVDHGGGPVAGLRPNDRVVTKS
jgi:hypothetical protein